MTPAVISVHFLILMQIRLAVSIKAPYVSIISVCFRCC